MASWLDRFCPDIYVDRLDDVDLDSLRNRGIDTVMLDLDNTLLPWRSSTVPESSVKWVNRARALGMRLCILSNTHNPRRLRKIAETLDVPCLHRALKPRSVGFDRAGTMLGSKPASTAVVGDQVLTDIWGGNRAGMLTVLVRPMHPYEFVGTKLSRVLEKIILALLRRAGKLGTKPIQGQSERTE